MAPEVKNTHPIVCLVSAGRMHLDPRAAAMVQRFAAMAGHAAAAGIDLIQLREPGLDAAQLVELAGAAIEAVAGSSTRVVVNDRLDVALAAGAAGVHLRADSVPARAARTLTPPGFLIGRSVHGLEETRAQAPAADYLIAGTVFPSRSKPADRAVIGTDGLRHIVEAAAGMPVLAIGGVTVERVGEIAAAGAAGIAAIGLFESVEPLTGIVHAIRAKFDSVKTAS
jgi:thiamine-phosphate diphosphorylase